MIETRRLHTPSFENHELPEGYGACLDCQNLISADQLFEEECPARRGDDTSR
jgi:hypothetical protein